VGSQLPEICYLTTKGEVLIDTIVNHEVSIRDVYERIANEMHRTKIDKVYGAQQDRRTPGMTQKQIGEILICKGCGPESFLVEWPTSGCDYCMSSTLIDYIRLLHHMPLRETSWLVFNDWRHTAKSNFFFELSTSFALHSAQS
jgi:hypothetical protein